MILMANDYVGYEITKYLIKQKESIDVFVYSSEGNPEYNLRMLDVVRSNPLTKIYSYSEIQNCEVLEYISSLRIKLGVLAWWPHIISKDMICVTEQGFVNTHPAYLPYNRGKHPYFWSLVENTVYGATIHYINGDIDAGEIIAQEKIEIDWTDTGESLYLKSREMIIKLFKDNYQAIRSGEAMERTWKVEPGTLHYSSELEKKSRIDLDKEYTARELLNILRGRMFDNKGSCYFYSKEIKYRISITIEEFEKDS